MLRSAQRRFPPAVFWLCAVMLPLSTQGGAVVRAQGISLPTPPSSPAPIRMADSATPPGGEEQDGAVGSVVAQPTGQLLKRDEILGLAHWDHTLLGAFELGARLLRSSATANPLEANAVVLSGKPFAVFSTSGGHSPFLTVSPLNQLSRNGMNVAMRSAFGNLSLTYREIFTGRPNTLGGGVGQASAAAMFTTPRFGSGGKFDFSAAALMGTGSINTLLGSGFGSSAIGGNGPGHKSQTSPTVALKFTF